MQATPPSALLRTIEQAADGPLPIRLVAYDGSQVGPDVAPATVFFKSPEAFRHLLMAPGELGFARAYINGDIDINGDIFAALDTRRLFHAKVTRELVEALVKSVLPLMETGKPEIPKEEMKLSGKLHTRNRDKSAVSSHYDVSNEFYRMVLGPSMMYSCAVRRTEFDSLEQAQEYKIDLICRKLGLQPGMYLLDIGCGWGQLLTHAAKHYHVRGVGLTLSAEQAAGARERTREERVDGLIEIREQDYRELAKSEVFDAISSVGMFEHVGRSQAETYFKTCFSQLKPGGRFMNHAISRAAPRRSPKAWETMTDKLQISTYLAPLGLPSPKVPTPGGFIDRYVFPDSELQEIGETISWMQRAGFEARHMESLREHYAWTLRQWVRNLQDNWDAAVSEVGEHRARIWLLYMAGAAVGFEHDSIEVHQTLAIKSADGKSGMPLRPEWENANQTA